MAPQEQNRLVWRQRGHPIGPYIEAVEVLANGNTAVALLTAKDPSLDLERKLIVKESRHQGEKGNEDLLRG